MGIEVCMRSEKRRLPVGIALMLVSALLTCCGQLCWKLSARGGSPMFLLAGFGLYGCGALLMMAALRFGELSVLHPMLSAGYALSVVLGALVLEEEITGSKLLGIAVITAGLVCLSTSKGQR